MSSLISTMLWGFVAAKAKQGLNAATKPESINIKQSINKGIFMLVGIALACGLKYSGEDKMLNSFVSEAFEGVNLAQQAPAAPVLKEAKPWWAEEEQIPEWTEEEVYYPVEDDVEEWMPEEEVYYPEEQSWEEEEEVYFEEEELEPRRHHGKRHHRREQEQRPRRQRRQDRPVVMAAPRKSLGQRLQEKFAANPEAMKAEYKTFAAFTGAFIVAIAVSFFTMMGKYHKAVKRHEFLLEIYKNPKAKVLPNERANEYITHKKTEKKHKRLVEAQQKVHEKYQQKMAQIHAEAQKLQAVNPNFFLAAPAYQPPKLEEDAKEYNYSLCESIDYQNLETSTLGVAAHANQMM